MRRKKWWAWYPVRLREGGWTWRKNVYVLPHQVPDIFFPTIYYTYTRETEQPPPFTTPEFRKLLKKV
jgi:hypothetical protein